MNSFEKRGKFLLSLRLKYNLKQSDLASIINCSNKTISNWERGICFTSDPKILIHLADLFNVSVDEILNGEYKNNNERKLKTPFEYKLIYFKCFALKYNLLLLFFILFLLSFCMYFLFNYDYNFFYNKSNKSSDNLEHYLPNFNNDSYNIEKLFDIGFVDSGNRYYQYIRDDVSVRFYYKIDLLKLYFYDKNNNILILSSKLNSNKIILEFFDKEYYNDKVLIIDKTKNCDVEICTDYNDYAMYINYLKFILKD